MVVAPLSARPCPRDVRSYREAVRPDPVHISHAICAHVRIGEMGSPPEIISLLLGAMTWATMVATNDVGAEIATLLTGPAWSWRRVIELGSMVSADQVAEQLSEVLNLDVKAFAVPRAGWAEAFEQFGIPKGHTGPAEEMYEAVNAGWMDIGVEGTKHVAGTTSPRDVFAAAVRTAAA